MHPKWLTGFLPSNRSDPLSNPVVVHMFAEANFFREFSKPQSKSGPLKFRHLSYQIVTRSQKSQKCRLSFPKKFSQKNGPWLPKNGWPIQFCLNLTCICSKPTNPPTAGSCLSSGPWDSSPLGPGDIHMPHHLPWHRRMPNVCCWQLLPRPVGNIRGKLPGGFQYILYFDPYLEKWSNLTNIFEMGWNHQPDERWSRKELISFDFSTGCWELTYPLPRRSHFL